MDPAEVEARRALDAAVVECRARIGRVLRLASSQLDPEVIRAINTLAVKAAAIGNKYAHAKQTVRPSQPKLPRVP